MHRADLLQRNQCVTQRGFDSGKAIADSEWEKTSLMAAGSARPALANGRGVVVDDTFSHRFLRDRFRAPWPEPSALPFVLLFLEAPLAVIEARIAENARSKQRAHIEPDVFARHRDRFQFPGNDETPVRLSNEADLDRWLAARRGISLGS